jgi:serine/threonine protein kinase
MDAAKGKLRELAAIANGHTLSEEEKKSHIQRIRRQLTGLGNIVPIVGITQIQRQDESGNYVDETIEISPKVNGRTLCDCIERNLPSYDPLRGIPKDKNIAIKLLLQLVQTNFTLHSCGYIRGDVNLQNIMIAKKGSSFTLKLIAWGAMRKITNEFNPINHYKIERILLKSFWGEQYTSQDKTGIYSPKTIDTIVQLSEDMLLKNGEKKVDLKAIISKLEALLNENKLENAIAKKNNAENLGENKEKSGEE